jgi:hypothetical protein
VALAYLFDAAMKFSDPTVDQSIRPRITIEVLGPADLQPDQLKRLRGLLDDPEFRSTPRVF